jgi:Zn finger protein HypA/HybF involved in hydrogenase expression
MSTHLDGNVLGGDLGELFTADITAATGQCASCGTVSAIAQTRVYTDAPGVVARCPSCGGVMLRFVRGPGRAWLDLRGIACLQLAVPDQP